MKLSVKLILSFFGVVLLLLSIGVASQYLNEEVKSRVVEKSEEAVQELQLSGEMGLHLYRSLVNTQYFLEDRYRKSLAIDFEETEANPGKPHLEVLNALNNFKNSLETSEAISSEINVPDSELSESARRSKELLQRLESKFDIYYSLMKQMLPLTRKNYKDGKEFFTVTIEPFFRTNLLPLVEALREQTRNNLNTEIDELNVQLSDVSYKLNIATIGAFILSMLLAYFLYRSIASPLNRLARAAQHIGLGNWNERIEINSDDEIGQLGREFNSMVDNLSNTTVSKDYMDNIIESMADALLVTDENGRIEKVNSAAVNMLDYQTEELLGTPFAEIYADTIKNGITQSAPDSVLDNYETYFRTKEGNRVPVSLSRAMMREREGAVNGTVYVASDITQRKEAEKQISNSLKEKEILLAEIHHRVKNNLAVISGLLQMQIWETDNGAAKSALKDSQLRVQSIALVHEKLYQSDSLSYIEFDKYINDLLQAISETYMDSETEVEIDTDLCNVALTINQAVPCSLLFNELIVNVYKHAFDNRPSGTLKVDMMRENESVRLKVHDNGKGIPEDYHNGKYNSLGLTLINTLTSQLKGELKAYNDNGAVFELIFEPEEVSSAGVQKVLL